MKSFFLIALGLSSSICMPLHAQTSAKKVSLVKSEADYFWDTKPAFEYRTISIEGKETYLQMPLHASGGKSYKSDLASFKQFNSLKTYAEKMESEKSAHIFSEILQRYFREWGIQFWKNFPNDPRRFEWLEETVKNAPVYSRNENDILVAPYSMSEYITIDLDTTALHSWQKMYQTFRKDYMQSSAISSRNKTLFLRNELVYATEKWRRQKVEDKFEYDQWVAKLQELDRLHKTVGSASREINLARSLQRSINMIIYGHRKLGMNNRDVVQFVSLLEKTAIPELQEFVKEYRNPRKMELANKYPFEFQGRTVEGKSIEIKDFKGKLVFVDIWSIGCGGCIVSMPKLKKIYDRYKQFGFEVISACFIEGKRENGTFWYPDEFERIHYVQKELSGDWPLILLDRNLGEKTHRIRTLYEFNMNPNYLLFDENGKLLHFNGELQYSLEDIIREHFIKQGKIDPGPGK